MTVPRTGDGWMTVDLTGVAAHAGGELCNLLNPEGHALIITRAVLYTTHVSTGACGLNVGIGTTAEHDQTEICSNVDIVAHTAGTASNLFACGDPADLLPVWGAVEYLVANGHGASSAGYTGRLHVEYIHA